MYCFSVLSLQNILEVLYEDSDNNSNAKWDKLKGVSMIYCKVTTSNTSLLQAHAGFFRLLMKGILERFPNQ